MILATLLFFLLIATDIFPFIRGPSINEWRWPYVYTNTWSHVFVPIIIFIAVAACYQYFPKSKEKLLLATLVFLSLCFSLSILYFGRGGVSVLFFRIANPGANGYFTASLYKSSTADFLHTYERHVLTFPMHAKGHPPGAVLFYRAINLLSSDTPLKNIAVSHLSPKAPDMRALWLLLSESQKRASMLAALFILLLTSLAIVPVYYAGKILSDKKTARIAAYLAIFVPSMILFLPLNDTILPAITVFNILLHVFAIKNSQLRYFVSSGFISFVGIFMSLSYIPVFVVFMAHLLVHAFAMKKEQSNMRILLTFYAAVFTGLIVPILALYIGFGFNFLTVTLKILSGTAHRSYFLWLFYNPFDFFIFAGVPITYLFFSKIFQSVSKISDRSHTLIDELALSFTLVLIILTVSGVYRAETGRVWLPFIPFVVLCASSYLIDRKFSNRYILSVLLLQALQVIIMQEFWVPLW